jgi:hypothetical protein
MYSTTQNGKKKKAKAKELGEKKRNYDFLFCFVLMGIEFLNRIGFLNLEKSLVCVCHAPSSVSFSFLFPPCFVWCDEAKSNFSLTRLRSSVQRLSKIAPCIPDQA